MTSAEPQFEYDVFLSFGLDAGGSFLNVDFSKGTFENPGEPILGAETINEFAPTIGAGVFLYHKDWYVGVSTPNFLTDGLSLNFLLNDSFTLGAAYRFDNAISGLAGFQVNNSIYIGYSYDYNTNGLGGFNSGSHEAIVKFYLGRGGDGPRDKDGNKIKGKQIDSPRFF